MRYTDENGISYELNEKNLTGQVVWSLEACGSITIPRSVIYDSKEYIIVSIHSGAFGRNHGIKAIQFSEDSELSLIESGAFSSSSLKYLSLPSSIQKLEDGWNSYLSLDFELKMPPNNQYFQYYNDQFVIGRIFSEKNENESDQKFECIVYSSHNVKNVEIPSFIKQINSFAFSRCKKLNTIEFSDESNLQVIDSYGFYQSSLSNAIIPRKAKEIGGYAFHECNKLHSIEFLSDDDIEFGYQCFHYCYRLKIISCPNAKSVRLDSLTGCFKNIRVFLAAGAEYKKF